VCRRITCRVITDHLGSVRMVVDANTGNVAQELRYDAFSRVLEDTNPGSAFGFGASGGARRDCLSIRVSSRTHF
jgi:hypothetical protein